ncbi:hypothetical protein TNCV_2487011 [Trichonephila clavipes]|uniref:Uncharacterized protein n=1 Tax=Trichonephila clavipes TaxID=2585209 RepID=A0A8X6W093_TRICX|nr:hypothetical protein TNCV_2487011 [Trichonephila clavipes]
MKSAFAAWEGRTLNVPQAVSLLVRLVEGEDSWEALDTLQIGQGTSTEIEGEIKPKSSVIHMVLKAMAKDMCTSSLCHNEFRRP